MSVGTAGRRLHFAVTVSLLVALSGVLLIGARRSAANRAEVRALAQEQEAGLRVVVVPAQATPPRRMLHLQGEVHAFANVTLYAKVAGYLGSVRVDKGDSVQAGQIVANIVSPELSQQLLAARADAANKRRQAHRMEVLGRPGVVAVQDVENASSGADVANAVEASLRDQDSYRILRAPFAGTVTERFADPGALIQSATSGQSGALPVVTIADTKRLRIYVYLDQSTAAFVKIGDPVTIRVPERPGWSRQGSVTRLSGELTTGTRTMLTEVDLDNRDGKILPGSFVLAEIGVSVDSRIEVPAEALVMRAGATAVAVVGGDNRLHFRPIQLAEDDGERARVLGGLEAGELVALNVGTNVDEGALVRPVRREGRPRDGRLSSK
ncbi:MAG: efflux RND transporter periplasmic adaptor subunit [Polyangia bacterium]